MSTKIPPYDIQKIRNFSIIAHIDHGKSTLADRLMEKTGTVTAREMKEQLLDSMDIERERGITIKAQTAQMLYTAQNGETYVLNLIDTPGHVDFAYEVSRSLAACEGAVLVVDATQGVEAQTLANVYLAMENSLELVCAINKIDLPAANVEGVREQVQEVVGLDGSAAVPISAKEGVGIIELLEAIVKTVPAPQGDISHTTKALIMDSWYDAYQGVVVLVRVMEGQIALKDRIYLYYSQTDYEVLNLGIFSPKAHERGVLRAGEVGYFVAGIKNIRDIKIGDTVFLHKQFVTQPEIQPLPGFKEVKPMVFAGIFPVTTDDYNLLCEAIEKLSLNDPSFTFVKNTSAALGFGFRCGFLGLLHMEIVQERLEREYNLSLITTAPSVEYKVILNNSQEVLIDNPSDWPDVIKIDHIKEPYIAVTIHTPSVYLGSIMTMMNERRGIQKKIEYNSMERVMVVYEMPLGEMILDFYDKLKSLTKGYASLDYEMSDYKESEVVKLDVMLNGEPVDALSCIVHKDKAYYRGRDLTKKLKELIDQQQFQVAIQAAIGSKIVARETLSALRKNVLAKCYGGDISRKRKLLEKQKEGKKRMKSIGNVEVPQEAFLAVLKLD